MPSSFEVHGNREGGLYVQSSSKEACHRWKGDRSE